jgi:hypothetical protein
LEFDALKIGYLTAVLPTLLIGLLPQAAFGQLCVQDKDLWSPSGVDHIEVTILGGWMRCMSMYWITADGQLYGMDYRDNSRPRGVSASTSGAVFQDLLEMALAAREASRRWHEDNPNHVVRSLDSLLYHVQAGDGICRRNEDGVDVSVSVSTDGATYTNECIGGQWVEFRRRFFKLVDEALEPALRQ